MGEIIDDEALAVADSMVKAYAPEASKRIEELEKENQNLKIAMRRAAAFLEILSRMPGAFDRVGMPDLIFDREFIYDTNLSPAPAQTFKPGSAEEIRP